MSIVFDWYENPNAFSEEEATLHPRIFMNGKVDTDKLCYKIHERSSLTVGDVKSALDTLAQLFGEELREGREVHLKGIGYFYPTLTATEKVTRSTPHKTNKVAFKTVRFRPDSELKGNLLGIRANQSKYVRHSEKISEVEIDIRLKDYFAEHQNIQELTRTVAVELIDQILVYDKKHIEVRFNFDDCYQSLLRQIQSVGCDVSTGMDGRIEIQKREVV